MNLETANIRMALHFSKEMIAAKENSISTIRTYVYYRIKRLHFSLTAISLTRYHTQARKLKDKTIDFHFLWISLNFSVVKHTTCVSSFKVA